jgi:hypothetical protein
MRGDGDAGKRRRAHLPQHSEFLGRLRDRRRAYPIKSMAPMQMKGIYLLNITVRFGNPFLVTIYTAALLMIGWAIGAYWGHTLAAGWMLLFATILLLLHDAAVAILLALAAAKIASYGRSCQKHK